MQNWRINKGFDCYDSNNEKIGTVGEVHDNYFQMDTGFLGLGKDYFIPFNAISDVRDDNVYIRTTKDRLDSMGFDQRPTGGPGMGPGGGRGPEGY